VTKSLRSPGSDDDALRRELRDHARARMAAAMAAGFFVEAVALQDSMISDRLEELLGQYKPRVAMNTLGQLAQLSRALDEQAFGPLAQRILEWAESRNVVVHQMVKVGPTHGGDWEQRLAQARSTAEQGRALLEAVDTAVDAHAESRVEGPTR
jgi:hypothetical protein